MLELGKDLKNIKMVRFFFLRKQMSPGKITINSHVQFWKRKNERMIRNKLIDFYKFVTINKFSFSQL